MQPRHLLMALVLIVIGYFIGVKFPALASKIPGM